MSIHEAITMFVIMVVLSAIPSTSVALVVTRSAALGIPNGIAAAAGIVLGDLVLVFLAVLGLAAVAEMLGGLFVFVRILGGLYLLWLGFSLFFERGQALNTVTGNSNKRSLAASFMAGFILTLGDIKAIVFYASLLPVFVDLSAIEAADMAVIVIITVFSVGGVKSVYAIFARKVAICVQRADRQDVARKTAGSLVICAGTYLIVKA